MPKPLVRRQRILALILAGSAFAARAMAQSLDECPSQGQIAEELLRGINAIRAEPRQCGAVHYAAAAKLTWNEVLFQVAQQHAADMARRDYFSHETPEGLAPGRRAEIAGYRWNYYGENIGFGQSSVKDVLNTWLASPLHCQGIMMREFHDVAVACAAANGKLWWALELGSQR